MTPMQTAYITILKYGVLAARQAADAGKAEVCRIEADHVHNIPDLLTADDPARHLYYFKQERGLYLDRISKLGLPNGPFFVQRFEEAWKLLEPLINGTAR